MESQKSKTGLLFREAIIRMASVISITHVSVYRLYAGMMYITLTTTCYKAELPFKSFPGTSRSNQKSKTERSVIIKKGKWLALLGKNDFE